jgi:hypothetical protein
MPFNETVMPIYEIYLVFYAIHGGALQYSPGA